MPALIPGKTAPRILTEDLVKLMRPDLSSMIWQQNKGGTQHFQGRKN